MATFGDCGFGSRRSRLEECSVLRDPGRRLRQDTRNEKAQAGEAKGAGGVTSGVRMPRDRHRGDGDLCGGAADRAEENVRSFPTFTQDVYRLAGWLQECVLKTVESNGRVLDSAVPDFGSMWLWRFA